MSHAVVPLYKVLPQIGYSRDTAYRLIQEKAFPIPLIRVGRRWYVNTGDVDDFRRYPECLDHFVGPDDVPLRVWRMVHHMAHTTASFTTETFMVLAECDADQALRAFAVAVDCGWLVATDERWLGQLA